MSETNLNYERICRQIYQKHGVEDIDVQHMVAFEIFYAARKLLKYGTIEFCEAINLHFTGFLNFANIKIGEDYYIIVRLDSNFVSACRTFINDYENGLPAGDIDIWYDDFDYYDRPLALLRDYDPQGEVDYGDYRGGDFYFMTENKLRYELKTRPYEWLLYRTSYRPGRNADLKKRDEPTSSV